MFSVGTAGTSSNAYNGQPLRGPLNIPDSPPRLARRAPRKGHKRETLADIARRVPVEVIRPYFNYPLRKAAEALSISVTTLKRLCRRHGVKRWPHRQLSGLNRAVSHLEAKRQAAQEGAADPVISDQLHQLYSRRDIVIDLAFMSDEEAVARGAETSKVETLSGSTNGAGQARAGRETEAIKGVVDDDGLASPGGMADPYAGANSMGWWNRDQSMTPSMMNGSGSRISDDGDSSLGVGSQSILVHTGAPGRGVERRCRGEETCVVNGDVGSDSGSGGGESGGLGGRLTDPSCQAPRGTDSSQRTSISTGFDDGAVSGDTASLSNYRTASTMVRLPGLAPAPQVVDGPPSWRKLKLPSPGSLLASMPSSTTAATSRVSSSSSGESPRRPLSPMTIGPSKGPPPPGGSGKLGVPRFHGVPAHHPSDTMDKQFAELSALNDILFGNDTEDVNALHMNGLLPAGVGQGSGVRSGGVGDPKAGIPAASSGQRVSAADGDGVGGGGGRLPSIAGLVAAGAYLNGANGEQWRSSRSGSGALLVRGRTGEV